MSDRGLAETQEDVLERLRLHVSGVQDDDAAAARRARSWDQLLADWRHVFMDVHEFMSSLDARQGDGPTMCDRWTQKDLVAHHIKGDRLTLQAFRGGDGFDFRTLDDGRQRSRADEFIDEFRPVPYQELVAQWREGFEELFDLSRSIEGEARYERVPWAAVPVSRIALLQARVSETFIHGWDSRWPLGATTRFDDTCWWVSDLAIRTTVPYGLRKAGAADAAGTYVFQLSGPGGGEWTRGAGQGPGQDHHVHGAAWAWLALATRRWTEHLGWRDGQGVTMPELAAFLSTPADDGVLLRAARAFV